MSSQNVFLDQRMKGKESFPYAVPWQDSLARKIAMGLLLTSLSSPAIVSAQLEFAYELKAQGTESPPVTFNAELQVKGVEQVISAEPPFTKFINIPDQEGKFFDEVCGKTTSLFCLPLNCELDRDRGGYLAPNQLSGNQADSSGYGILVDGIYDTGNGNASHHLYQASANGITTWCVDSRIKVCTESTVDSWAHGHFNEPAYYNGRIQLYGKCTKTQPLPPQSQKVGPFSLSEQAGYQHFAQYDAPIIRSPNAKPKTRPQIQGYDVKVLSVNDSQGHPITQNVLQVAMTESPTDPAAHNGEYFWAKTTYRVPWVSVKSGTALVPDFTEGVKLIDSIATVAPNQDTVYSVSVTTPPCPVLPCPGSTTFLQNDKGMVEATGLVGWISGPTHDLFVSANQSLTPPVAIIDHISPNPAPVGTQITLQGHGEYNNSPNPPITHAQWQTNRSQGVLGSCEGVAQCVINKVLDAGQHLISFFVEVVGNLRSPDATSMLKVNIPPVASITSIEGTGEKDGVITVVKWKDDAFDTTTDLITFVGQAVDLDGQITEYRWESNLDGVLSDKPAFSTNRLRLGEHKITFKAKDDSGVWSEPARRGVRGNTNNGVWSNAASKTVKVIKPPVLLVHGLCGDSSVWASLKTRLEQNAYPVTAIDIRPNNEHFSFGAARLAEEIDNLKNFYGVPKVNIVAHSMGGLDSRWYIQNFGYKNDVNKLVMLGTPNHGSTLAVLARPFDSGGHIIIEIVPLYRLLSAMTNLLAFLGPLDCQVSGSGTMELIPQSSALRSLNRNKKDEGCSDNECGEREVADNISTVYGNWSKVQYFNIFGSVLPSPSHQHIVLPIVGIDIIIPTLSLFSTDFVVHKKSILLDSVPSNQRSFVGHGALPKNSETIQQSLYYLGDDPPQSSENIDDAKFDSQTALAGHVIYTSDAQKVPVISAGESPQIQSFEVDAGIKNLHVMVIFPNTEETGKLKVNLVSPSGAIIDAGTTSPQVQYVDKDSSMIAYHIAEAEAGQWSATVEATSGQAIKYALMVTGETDFWVGVVEGTHVEPGQPFTMTAYAQKTGVAMPGLAVKAVLLKTLDEGERIGSKYGKDLRTVTPEEVALADLGDGRYELAYTNTLAPGTYRVFISATDPLTKVSRVSFTTFFVEYQYQLSVQSSDIVFSKDNPEPDELITVSAKVHNDTSIEAKGVEVWFADGSLSKQGKVFAKQTVNLPAGGYVEVSAPWKTIAGSHDLFVIVSPMNTFIEEKTEDNSASRTIGVIDNPPVAYAGANQVARFDTTMQSNVNIFPDGSGSTDDLKIERYEWDIDTQFDSSGDSIPDNDIDLTGEHPVIPMGTYSALGTYPVKLTVVDNAGQGSSSTMEIRLTEDDDFEPPQAEAGDNQTTSLGVPVTFDGSGASDNYGIATYVWDIDTSIDSDGDGIADNDVDLVGMRPTLKSGYAIVGNHTVKLTVTDTAGNEPATDTTVVKVTEEPIPEGSYIAKGHLEDLLGNSIAGVKVQVDNKITFTDQSGRWRLSGLSEGQYTLTANKAGYTFASTDFQVGNDHEKQWVTVQGHGLLKVVVDTYSVSPLLLEEEKEETLDASEETAVVAEEEDTEPTETVEEKPEPTAYFKAISQEQPLGQGEDLAYFISVTNEGDRTATGITLTDKLPTGTTLASMEAVNRGTCDEATVTCSLPNLLPGETARVRIIIHNTLMETLNNQVIVSSNEYPDEAQVTPTTVAPYLSVLVSDVPDPVVIQGGLHYQLDVGLSKLAPTPPATGIQLVMQLSPGLSLQMVSTDDGSCDGSRFPTITCALKQLELDTHALVNIDVQLSDPGLLLLNHEAKVTATSYPGHTVTGDTNIFVPEDIKVGMIFVIDTTNSMQPEINGVRDALKQFIAKVPSASHPTMALVEFKDYVRLVAFTQNAGVMLGEVEKLTAAGGGTCPEASAEALAIALRHIQDGGTIVLATDASPYPESDLTKLGDLIKSKGVKFHALVSGDCAATGSSN